MHKRIYVVSALVLFVLACNNQNTQSPDLKPAKDPGKVKSDVVYGEDNRLDLYEVTNQAVVSLATSTVALMQSSSLRDNNGTTSISTSTFGSSQNMCTTEKFYDQPVAAFCSGSLVAPNIVLTAGHCITSNSDCANTKFVFGFGVYQKEVYPTKVPTSEVYGCAEIIHREQNNTGADFAVIRLNRTVTNHAPLRVRAEGTVSAGDPVLVIGHPVGLPTKVAGSANVRRVGSGFFVANLDTYGGNSGSAVFNANTGLIEGVLVRGENDFVNQGTCRVSNVCSDSGCHGEDVTQISSVLPYLPAQANPSPTPLPSPSPGQQDKYEASPNLAIPDNTPSGIYSELEVQSAPNGRKVLVSVNIQHTWIGDLIVKLTAPNGSSIVLSNNEGGSADDIVKTYELPKEFSDINVNGKWRLDVSDTASADVGVLKSWSVTLQSR